MDLAGLALFEHIVCTSTLEYGISFVLKEGVDCLSAFYFQYCFSDKRVFVLFLFKWWLLLQMLSSPLGGGEGELTALS